MFAGTSTSVQGGIFPDPEGSVNPACQPRGRKLWVLLPGHRGTWPLSTGWDTHWTSPLTVWLQSSLSLPLRFRSAKQWLPGPCVSLQERGAPDVCPRALGSLALNNTEPRPGTHGHRPIPNTVDKRTLVTDKSQGWCSCL